MIDKISIGQYFPKNSFIHNLDARVKILLSIAMMIIIFMSWNYITMLIVSIFIFLLMLISRVPIKYYFKSARLVLFFAFLSSILNLFYGDGEALLRLGIFTITESGIRSSIIVIVRISSLLFMGSILMFTTSPTDVTYAIESIISPLSYFKVDVQDMAMMMTISLRFMTMLIEECDKIIRAQKSRGADMKNKSLITRLKSYIPVLFPLFILSFRRAYDLATAMECRCYGSLAKRTRMKEFKIGGCEVIAVISVLILFVLICIFSVYKVGAR